MVNSYTEEFKRNTVAIVRAGFGINSLADRLNIPPTSIRNWVGHPKYSDVQPAGEDLIGKLPDRTPGVQNLVQIGEHAALMNRNCLPELKIRIGSAEITVPRNTHVDTFRILMQALRDAHVL